MRRVIEQLIQDRVAVIGTFGTAWTVVLDRIHSILGILVGLATFTYLILKITRELRKKS